MASSCYIYTATPRLHWSEILFIQRNAFNIIDQLSIMFRDQYWFTHAEKIPIPDRKFVTSASGFVLAFWLEICLISKHQRVNSECMGLTANACELATLVM